MPGGLAVAWEQVAVHLRAWTDRDDPVTAIACFNDYHAAVCLQAAQQVGLWVPYDLAVIGLDDDVFAPFTFPPLTTVRIDPHGFAVHLWSMARHLLGEAPEPSPYRPAAHLVERDTLRPALRKDH